MKPSDIVRPQQLATLLDQHPGVELLTVDCFDTIIWRRVYRPMDVFKIAERSNSWRLFDVSCVMRVKAEQVARRKSLVRGGTGEVSIWQIFSECSGPGVQEMVDAEWEAELEVCYRHPSTIDMIGIAKSRGVQVVVVSDTYWTGTRIAQLTGLDVPHVTSSDFNLCKRDGLLARVFEQYGGDPTKCLHVGDNLESDFHPAKKARAAAVLLKQVPQPFHDRERLGVVAGRLLMNDDRPSFRVLQEVVSQSEVDNLTTAELVGYATVGPIIAAFAHKIVNTSCPDTLDLFLMRDAWLVRQACNELVGEDVGVEVEISRFAAIASTFRSVDDVVSYLAPYYGKKIQFKFLARQLLVEDLYTSMLEKTAEHVEGEPSFSFNEWATSKAVVDVVVERSERYWTTLSEHFEDRGCIGLQKKVRFIDLGYEGTVERTVGKVLRSEGGTKASSLYLLALGVLGGQRDRRDAVISDPTIAVPLVQHIAVLEMFCSMRGGSVVSYVDGKPVRAPDTASAEVKAVVEDVQRGALRFVRDAMRTGWFQTTDPVQTVVQCLGRLEFFPSYEEIAITKDFRLEVNLGSDQSIPLIDPNRAVQSMRRAGFFSASSKVGRRLCVGAELATLGLENSIAYAAIVRSSLDLRHDDFARRSLPIVVLAGVQTQMSEMKLRAFATYDGFHVIDVPPRDVESRVEIVFDGMTLVQFESFGVIPYDLLYRPNETVFPTEYELRGLVDEGAGMMRSSSNRCRFVVPRVQPGAVVRLVFRPLVGK